jgi:hypothetical protein
MSALAIDHGCFSGSESQFDFLRCMWSQAAGYGVYDFRNQGGPMMPRLDLDAFSQEDMEGDWPNGAPDDPLLILLVHSERSGRIQWGHANYLADRLEELEAKLMSTSRSDLWVLLTQQFIRGLRTAAMWRQDVEFS